jgi:uncharacterized protein (TIGR03084 family)
MSTVSELRGALIEEQNSLDAVVASLTSEQWHRATASPGWSVFDQIAHLAYFDDRGALAISDPERFGRDLEVLIAQSAQASLDEITLAALRALSPRELVEHWRDARAALDEAAASLTEDARVAWYGPSMGAASFLTARLMETWAHGVDVTDALHVTREATQRLRHVAQLGFITRQWSYRVRGESAPDEAVRLALEGPGGESWRWGPDDVEEFVEGSAEEFCLVVTQRRHVADTALVASEWGYHWLARAQAFAGAASDGPPPRSHP